MWDSLVHVSNWVKSRENCTHVRDLRESTARQHTSCAAAIVVQQLHGVVDGDKLLGSALLALLSLGRRTEVTLPGQCRLDRRHQRGNLLLLLRRNEFQVIGLAVQRGTITD